MLFILQRLIDYSYALAGEGEITFFSFLPEEPSPEYAIPPLTNSTQTIFSICKSGFHQYKRFLQARVLLSS